MTSRDVVIEAADALDMARAVAGEASAMLRQAAGTSHSARTKSTSRDPVTEWDTRCEDLIRERLHALTPDIPLLGEESGVMAAPGRDSREYQWLVDPIDGTVNFMHGVPFFCVSIALEKHGQPIAGAVYAPALGWEFHGCRGGGAYLGEERIRVSQVDELEKALLSTGFPYDRATNPDNNFDRWCHFQRKAGACRRFGAAALDLSMVACGWLDGYWERGLHPWDSSAGALLVEEAGGMMSAWDGSRFSSASGEVLATNGIIHSHMMAELAAVGRAW